MDQNLKELWTEIIQYFQQISKSLHYKDLGGGGV